MEERTEISNEAMMQMLEPEDLNLIISTFSELSGIPDREVFEDCQTGSKLIVKIFDKLLGEFKGNLYLCGILQ